MGDGIHRIGAALAGSALVHLLIFGHFVPAGTGMLHNTLFSPLTARLERGPSSDPLPPPAPEVVPDPDPPPEEARTPAEPAPVLPPTPALEAPARAVEAPTGGESTRAAAPSEVKVSVLLMGGKNPDNSQDIHEAWGQRYVYFDSPTLKSAARPLADVMPRYPAGKLTQPDGAVLLQLLIGTDGALEGVDTVCAAPPFEKSARESIAADLRFTPAMGAEGPVRSYMLVEFAYGRGFPCARVRQY